MRLDRGYNKKGGGLIMYIRDDLDFELLDKKLNESDLNIELLSIIIKRKYQSNLCISLVYLPPKSEIDRAIEALTLVGTRVCSSNTDWILGGDMNIDLSSDKTSRKKRQINNFITRFLLQQTIVKATRICATTSTLIDHIYSNKPEKVDLADVISYGISDHYLTFISLKKNLEKKEKVSFSCRRLANYTLDSLCTQLNTTDWSDFYNEQNPNIVGIFCTIIT